MISQNGFSFAKRLEIFRLRLCTFAPNKRKNFKFLDSYGNEIMSSLKYKPPEFPRNVIICKSSKTHKKVIF